MRPADHEELTRPRTKIDKLVEHISNQIPLNFLYVGCIWSRGFLKFPSSSTDDRNAWPYFMELPLVQLRPMLSQIFELNPKMWNLETPRGTSSSTKQGIRMYPRDTIKALLWWLKSTISTFSFIFLVLSIYSSFHIYRWMVHIFF
jgi:hypothetical protein